MLLITQSLPGNRTVLTEAFIPWGPEMQNKPTQSEWTRTNKSKAKKKEKWSPGNWFSIRNNLKDLIWWLWQEEWSFLHFIRYLSALLFFLSEPAWVWENVHLCSSYLPPFALLILQGACWELTKQNSWLLLSGLLVYRHTVLLFCYLDDSGLCLPHDNNQSHRDDKWDWH